MNESKKTTRFNANSLDAFRSQSVGEVNLPIKEAASEVVASEEVTSSNEKQLEAPIITDADPNTEIQKKEVKGRSAKNKSQLADTKATKQIDIQLDLYNKLLDVTADEWKQSRIKTSPTAIINQLITKFLKGYK